MVAFHYVVKAKIIRHMKESGEIEFLEFEEKFEDSSPIIARNKAFQHYQNYIDVFLQSKEKTYTSDKEANEELKSFTSTGRTKKLKIGGEEFEYSNDFGNGIGVFLIVDVPKPEQSYEDLKGEEIFIHGIGNISSANNPDSLMSELNREFEYYRHFKYETKNKINEIVFCNSDEWAEGYLGDGKWLESYEEPNSYKILETPFDWTGFDKPYWWSELDDEEHEKALHVPTTIEDYIANGESNQMEFKPALVYNFSTGTGGIGVKVIIAKAICAFLNSNGGFLIIGVKDNGEPQGLSYDFSLSENKDERDYFMLEFDDMLKRFLSFSVKSNVLGQFYELNGKDIFVVAVSPSKRRPIFLNGQAGKEFYVRGEASSRQLRDVEELVNYCLEKWGTI